MLVECSSDAHLMLIQYSFNHSALMLIENIWVVFEFRNNFDDPLILIQSLWMLSYCSSMLVQSSLNAHLMLIQYSFDYSASNAH